MPPSMRRQTVLIKKRQERPLSNSTKRKVAVEMLKEKRGVRAISRVTGVDKSMVSKLKLALGEKDQAELEILLDGSRAQGVRRVLSDEEECMIVEKCLFAARRGFALDDENLKTIMARIAQDGRPRG